MMNRAVKFLWVSKPGATEPPDRALETLQKREHPGGLLAVGWAFPTWTRLLGSPGSLEAPPFLPCVPFLPFQKKRQPEACA